MLEILRVVACLDRSPARWPRRSTVAAAFVGAGAWTPGPVAAVPDLALAAVWCPIPGSIRPSAVAIFVVGATAAVIEAPFMVHAVTALALVRARAQNKPSGGEENDRTPGNSIPHTRNPDLRRARGRPKPRLDYTLRFC